MVKKTKINFSKNLATFLIIVNFILFFPVSVSASSITETNILNLTNNERAKYGAASLSWNYKLATAARSKAQDMIDKDYFSHTSPDGRTPWSFITAAGYNYIYAGENLAMNFTSAEDVMSAWMASGSHRDNILSGNFKELGVGVVTGEYQGYTTTVVVQMFGAQATTVYREKRSSTTQRQTTLSTQSSSVTSTFNYSTLAIPGGQIIKKRIEDFKKACDYLIRIVREKS